MAGPTVIEILTRLRNTDRISASEYRSFAENYEFFQSQRDEIYRKYSGRWVASLQHQLHFADQFYYLIARLRDYSDHRFAYIEQVQ